MEDFLTNCLNNLAKTNSDQPIYCRIAEEIKSQITCGKLPEGTKLPPESSCAARLGVNLQTYRKSMKILAEQGLLYQCRGRGTFVCHARDNHLRIAMIFLGGVDLSADPYHSRVLSEICCQLINHHNCETVLLTPPAGTPAKKLLKELHKVNCDGAICFAHPFIKALSETCFDHYPLVIFNPSLSAELPENRFVVRLADGAIRLAVRYLMDQGVRNISYISTDSASLFRRNSEFARIRKNHKLRAEIILPCPDNISDFYRKSFEKTIELCRSSRPPRAIILPNTLMAAGTVSAIQVCGLRIPDDIAVIGFDQNPWCSPELSSINQPLPEMLEHSINLLCAQIIGSGKLLARKHQTFPATLVERGSSIIKQH